MSSSEKTVTANFILEIIGKPKEYLVQALDEMITKINSEERVVVTNKVIHEPLPMKDSKEFFTTYAEIEIEVEEPIFLAILMFKYMPSHVEIVSPERMVFQNNSFSDILNELTRRLHGYDELARIFQLEKQEMQNKINELTQAKEVKKSKPKKAKKK